jgi:hypothetical protein
MSEVSSVSRLITALLALALAAGAGGTLYDLNQRVRTHAKRTLKNSAMSYRKWNRQLLSNSRPIPHTNKRADSD